jgi:hypothetical protein
MTRESNGKLSLFLNNKIYEYRIEYLKNKIRYHYIITFVFLRVTEKLLHEVSRRKSI